MTSITFPEANLELSPPLDLEEGQCAKIKVWRGYARRGSCDGMLLHVAAWMPSPEELAALNAGAPVFFTVGGGMPPHFITTNFNEASNPA